MRKILYVVMVCMTSWLNPGLMAQECEPERSVTDDFTGVTTHLYGGELGSGGSLWYGYRFTVSAFVYRQEEQSRIVLWLSYYQSANDAGVDHVAIPEGSVFRFKTAEGMLEFAVDEVTSQKRKVGSKVKTSLLVSSGIDTEGLEFLSRYPLEMFQITPTGKQSMTGEVTTRKREHFQRQVWCFVNGGAPVPSPAKTILPKSRELEQGRKYLEPSFGVFYTSLNVRFEYFVADQASIGGGLGYAFGEKGGIDIRALHVAPFVRYYLMAKSTGGVYFGLSLGYVKATASVDNLYLGRISTTASGLYYDFHLGGKLKVGDNLFLLGELALAPDGSILRAGVAIPL